MKNKSRKNKFVFNYLFFSKTKENTPRMKDEYNIW